MKNVAITTNMWGNVSPEIGEARERQLSTVFFKPAIDKGARLLRHEKTVESAHSVIRALLDNDPLALQIQEELVDKHMEFTQTAAGEEIRRILDKHAETLEEKIQELRSELEDAENKEQETQRELEEEIVRLRGKLEEVRDESMQLEARYQEQKEQMRSKTDTMMNNLFTTLAGVFKMGFVSGFVLSALLGFVPSGGLVLNAIGSFMK